MVKTLSIVPLLVAMALLPLPALANIDLKIDPVKFGGGTSEVRFHSQGCDIGVPLPENAVDRLMQKSTEHYIVFVDLSDIHSPESTDYTVYKFYVQSKPGASGHAVTCLFLVQAQPTGSFKDQIVEVHFQVGQTASFEDASMRLPVHSTFSAEAMLESPPPETLPEVRPGSASNVGIKLINRLSDLPLVVERDVEVIPSHPFYWKATSGMLGVHGDSDLALSQGQTLENAIVLQLQPDPWKALGATFRPLAASKSHDKFFVNLSYFTRGGFRRMLQVPVEVRFVPSLWSLLLAVLGGSLLGSLVPLVFSSGGRGILTWLQAFGAAFVVAILAWLVGLVMVSLDSRFRIFGIELDPFQIVPASLIGAFVGLYGFHSADAVKEFINKHFAADSGK